MHEQQTSVLRRQQVVDDHLFPLAEHPEVETEDAAVAWSGGETLAVGYDPSQQVRVPAEARYSSQQPTVTCHNTAYLLGHVECPPTILLEDNERNNRRTDDNTLLSSVASAEIVVSTHVQYKFVPKHW